jgi:alanine racemase
MMVGPLPDDHLETVFDYNLEPVIFDRGTLTGLGKLASRRSEPVRTHLKLETGTNRQGITEKEFRSYATIYKKHRYLQKPYGASTHFANIEDTTSHEYAQHQLDRFNRMVLALKRYGVGPTIRHTACSAALILFEKTRFDLVRPGISVYGHWPSKETYLSYRLEGGHNRIFRPVLRWRTRVTQIKSVAANSFIGYGCTYRTTANTRLAVLPLGYCDGYDRALSNTAYVLIRGRRAPIRGRICMNLIMADITDIPEVKVGQVATLIGKDGRERLSAEQLADWAGTINYEILSRLSLAIPRIIVR